MHRYNSLFVLVIIISIASIFLQVMSAGSPAPASASGAPGAPTLEELAGASYSGIYDKPIRLTKGRFEGEPFYPGGASVPAVGLVEGFLLTGDLDGDGTDEAVVLLWENSGGSGTRIFLAAAGRENGSPVNRATALVGDRVQIRKGHIEDGRIVLDVVQAGADDAGCCPGEKAIRSWTLKGDTLAEGTPQVTGRLSLADLSGVDWVLRKLSREEKAPAGSEITLLFEGDGISGFSGCNRYFGGVEAGDMPGDLAVKGVGGTKKACPEPLMNLESRYLQALGGMISFRFIGGHLALTTVRDDVYDTLLFSPR